RQRLARLNPRPDAPVRHRRRVLQLHRPRSAELAERLLRLELSAPAPHPAHGRSAPLLQLSPGDPTLTGRRHSPRRQRSSSPILRSAVGRASSRASGIGLPLSTESPYVPSRSLASARSSASIS